MNTYTRGGFAPDFAVDWRRFRAAVWRDLTHRLKPITSPDCPPLDSLVGMERQKQQLLANTRAFVSASESAHALLWGARGCGKSSLIRALLPVFADEGLRMVQLGSRDLYILEELIDHLREQPWRFILLCDDLNFSGDEAVLSGLKVLLEGSLEPTPHNLLFYASSNRRHLLPESSGGLAEVGEGGELHHGDQVETTLALADRFGLWLSFYSSDQEGYLSIVAGRLRQAGVAPGDGWREQAMRFARERGVFSGRTARHFVNSLLQWSNPEKA